MKIESTSANTLVHENSSSKYKQNVEDSNVLAQNTIRSKLSGPEQRCEEDYPDDHEEHAKAEGEDGS